MKIALYHNLPSGGAKRALRDHIAHLAFNNQIDLFTLSTANQSFTDVQPYVGRIVSIPFQPFRLLKRPLGRINQGIRVLDLLRIRQLMRVLAAQINAGGYQLALVHPCQYTITPALLRFINIPSLYYRQDVVRWIHDPPTLRPYQRQTKMHRFMNSIDPFQALYRKVLVAEDRINSSFATQMVVNSYFVRESIYRLYGVPPEVCYLGVDTDQFHPLGLNRDNFVLSVGMIHPYKGYDFLIDSLACIPVGQRPCLVIVGNMADQSELAFLQIRSQEKQVAIDFRQMISDKELLELYNKARCVVYAPYMESFGLVPLEAMACETPVVGILEGGVRETIIHEVNGLMADRDPTAFANQVTRLLSDDVLVRRLGKQARQHVIENWSIQAAMMRLETHLEAVSGTSIVKKDFLNQKW